MTKQEPVSMIQVFQSLMIQVMHTVLSLFLILLKYLPRVVPLQLQETLLPQLQLKVVT